MWPRNCYTDIFGIYIILIKFHLFKIFTVEGNTYIYTTKLSKMNNMFCDPDCLYH